jgi:hypothetical protein
LDRSKVSPFFFLSFSRQKRRPVTGSLANHSTQKVGLALNKRKKRITGVFSLAVLKAVEKVKDILTLSERDIWSGLVLALPMDK